MVKFISAALLAALVAGWVPSAFSKEVKLLCTNAEKRMLQDRRVVRRDDFQVVFDEERKEMKSDNVAYYGSTYKTRFDPVYITQEEEYNDQNNFWNVITVNRTTGEYVERQWRIIRSGNDRLAFETTATCEPFKSKF